MDTGCSTAGHMISFQFVQSWSVFDWYNKVLRLLNVVVKSAVSFVELLREEQEAVDSSESV